MTDLYGSRELSPQQKQIVVMISEGMKNHDIAKVLGITDMVIKNYIRAIFDKTGMSSRLELALWYVSRQ